MNTKAVASIIIGIAIIVGIFASFGFMQGPQNEEQNEIVLEESIEMVEDFGGDTKEETPGKQFTIELKESVSVRGE
ncbi:MAG: hypothetical protein ACE5RJ_01860 [Nitrosopumilaceae archaeon]